MKLEKNDTGTSILFVSVVLTYLYFTKIFSSKMYAQYAQSKIVRFDCMYGTYRTYLSVKRRFKKKKKINVCSFLNMEGNDSNRNEFLYVRRVEFLFFPYRTVPVLLLYRRLETARDRVISKKLANPNHFIMVLDSTHY